MGIGRATGDNRAIEAARMAIDNPLLDISIEGAKGILFNITGGPDMSMYEIDEAAKAITEASHPDANTIFGALVDETMGGEIKITVIATGFDVTEPRDARRPQVPIGAGHNAPAASHTIAPKTPLRIMDPEPEIDLTMEAVDEDASEDSELDVPAFIRRKLK
jgi:cell division protein FtsZ